jgi:hypothetical protein
MILLFLRRILPTLFLDGDAMATDIALFRNSRFSCDGVAIMSLRIYNVFT